MGIANVVQNRKSEDGFTLAELTVAMAVGAIIFSMAVAFLISFSSTAYQANAKSEVTNVVRTSLTNILKQVSSAATQPNCVQWKSEAAERDYNTPLGHTVANIKQNCTQLVNGSEALLKADKNAVCWNKAVDSSGSTILFPDKIACLYKGGSGVICHDTANTNKDVIYIAECLLGTDPLTVIDGTSKIVADLGPHKDAVGDAGNFPVRSDLFKYVNYDSSAFTPGPSSTPSPTGKVLKVSVNAEISYENGRFKDGTKDYGTYKYSSTIQLAGMRAYLETGAYGN